MDKLRINLIPPEVKEKAKKDAKKTLVVRISIGLLGLLILATSGILATIIYQGAAVQALNSSIEGEKTQITTLKDKEAVVFFLKNRIDTINKFADKHYKQGDYYDLITSLSPQNVKVVSLGVDKTDKVLLQGETLSTFALEELFNRLTDPQTNEGKIKSVSVESLNRAQNGTVRFSLVINMKEKAQ